MKYKVKGTTTVEIVTVVEADSEEQAIQEAEDRDVEICIHGSELAEHEINEDEFCLVDGGSLGVENLEAEEL